MLNLNKLTKQELIELINVYDDYIQDANDEDLYREEWKPVCISEFYMNDLEFWRNNKHGKNRE